MVSIHSGSFLFRAVNADSFGDLHDVDSGKRESKKLAARLAHNTLDSSLSPLIYQSGSG
jgi:hypothetical protein